MPYPRPEATQEIGDGEDRLVDLHSPEVPPTVRARVLALAQPGDQLWRCPRRSAPRGPLGILGVGQRDVVREGRPPAAQGELVAARWGQ